jgi:hypothetical protein
MKVAVCLLEELTIFGNAHLRSIKPENQASKCGINHYLIFSILNSYFEFFYNELLPT